MVNNWLESRRPGFNFLGGEDPLDKGMGKPTPAFLASGKSRQEPGYSPRGFKGSDTTGN